MPLPPGTRIGPYEILSALGAGGMGEVYRAHDARLSRDVALKVLPADFTQDRDRLKRFESEARAAGALNHPNLLTVFDVGRHDGTPYLVTELLQGTTLREALAGGPLPLRKCLDLGAQIGRGLAAAHEKGIVHRDLKPENLFVTADGRAKILDFGLAKLNAPLEPVMTGAATVTSPSSPGSVLGTVGYMSPEQVRAEPVDARSDIFSFGAVLYEMLSGRRAFRGETSVETLNAILKEDPPDISEPGHPLPAALERTVRRSLEKDPRARFQSAQDLAFALEALSGDTRASSTGAIPIHGAAVASRRAWLAATGAGLALAVAAFFVGRRSAEHPAPTFERLTYRHGRVGEARFAPDGQTIVYSAEWEAQPPRLFSARAGSMESRPLDLPDAALLAVSSSGEMALSLRSQWDATQDSPRGTLARVPLAGGAPREVVDGVLGADWSPDGSVLAAIRPGHGLEFPLGSSIARSDGDGFGHPRVSPRGDLVALFEWRGWPCAVVVIDRKGATRALTGYDYRLCSGLAWSPDGKEIWFTGVDASGAQPLRAVSLEGRTRVVHAMPGRSSLRDISREGDVLLTSGLVRFSVYGHVPGADAERNLSWFGNSYLEDLSADGSTILLGDFLSGAGVNPIFMRRTDGSPAVRLGDGEDGRISPDGKWVAASLAHPPRIVLLPTGAGPSRELPVAPCTVYNLDWFADGRRLLATCRKNDAGHTVVTWTQDLEGGAPHPILDGYMGILAAPDGRSVLAVQGEDGLYHLCALDGGGCRKLETLDAEKEEPLRWSSDSRSLFVAAHSGEASLTLARMDVATGRREVLKTLAPPDPTGVFGLSWIQITPDGRHYAYSFGRWLSDLYLVKGLR